MSAMQSEALRSYIANLPVGAPLPSMAEDTSAINTIDIDNLPNGIVSGSNLIQFPAEASPELKSSVALSLLAAQRVATNDPVVLSPAQWLDRHNTVLQNLNWRNEGGGVAKSQFDSMDVAVHQAIIPFLTAAFGGAVAAGALILTALKQLQEMDKDAPWITLFDRQSRRFEVTEYQFSIVQVVGDTVHLKMAAARLNASFGKTQVLFFKVKTQNAEFEQANQSFSSEAALLAEMNADLKVKLMTLTKSFIRSLPDDLLRGDAGN
jgi:hypothetical protein